MDIKIDVEGFEYFAPSGRVIFVLSARKYMRKYFLPFSCLLIALLSFFTEWYVELSIALGVVLLVMLLDKLGKGIVLRETIAFLYVFTCLIMPIVGYEYYDSSNSLSKLWVRYMPIPRADYFSYCLPAIGFFCFALLFPLPSAANNEEGVGLTNQIARIKERLVRQKKLGLVVSAIGLLVSLVINYLPAGLQFFATLFFFGSFAGLLYIYYAPAFRYKYLLMLLFILFIFYNALNVGMFTVVAYMGITISSFLLMGKKVSLLKKMALFCLAAFLMIVLQNTKLSYRKSIWRSGYGGSKVELFTDLFANNVLKGEGLVEKNAFFQIYVRGNQGYNVALVMRRMPVVKPFDGGNNLMKAFASAFVPRFLWPDKPEAGGKFNMEYYAGWHINGWSTNVGPLGEAYGSFGVTGGIIYMFFLGLFIRLVYVSIFRISRGVPLLICWLPVFFFQIVSSAETDSLQIFNSLIKAAFFVWLLNKLLPHWFGVLKKQLPLRNKRKLAAEPA